MTPLFELPGVAMNEATRAFLNMAMAWKWDNCFPCDIFSTSRLKLFLLARLHSWTVLCKHIMGSGRSSICHNVLQSVPWLKGFLLPSSGSNLEAVSQSMVRHRVRFIICTLLLQRQHHSSVCHSFKSSYYQPKILCLVFCKHISTLRHGRPESSVTHHDPSSHRKLSLTFSSWLFSKLYVYFCFLVCPPQGLYSPHFLRPFCPKNVRALTKV